MLIDLVYLNFISSEVIGRGNKKVTVFLGKSKEESTERLKILEKTSNGFNISDEDLKLRGPGEFWDETAWIP